MTVPFWLILTRLWFKIRIQWDFLSVIRGKGLKFKWYCRQLLKPTPTGDVLMNSADSQQDDVTALHTS